MLSPEFHSETEIRNRIGSQNIGILAIPPTSISWLSQNGFRRSNLKLIATGLQGPSVDCSEQSPLSKDLAGGVQKRNGSNDLNRRD